MRIAIILLFNATMKDVVLLWKSRFHLLPNDNYPIQHMLIALYYHQIKHITVPCYQHHITGNQQQQSFYVAYYYKVGDACNALHIEDKNSDGVIIQCYYERCSVTIEVLISSLSVRLCSCHDFCFDDMIRWFETMIRLPIVRIFLYLIMY